MKSDYPKIFEPITIKRTTIKNRIAMTPMGTNYGETSGEISKTDMESLITGSIIKSMTVAELRKIDIPNIAIEKQLEMEQLIKLCEKEKNILEEILKKKEKIYNWYLEEMVKKGEIANEPKTSK